jgi:nucleoprotein TPR
MAVRLIENARAQLETELQALKSSSSSSASEVQALQSRVATLESSNRDALSLVESKSTAHDRLADELSAQHQKMLMLRREVSELSEKNQTLENASMSTKFREQALQQEVELLKKNNEWYESELQTRNADHAKFRKEKVARISELQRLNEDATQTIESLRHTETTLRNRLDEVNQKAEDGFTRIQQLEEERAKAQESFRVELDGAHRLATLQRQGADMAKARLQEVQSELQDQKDAAAEEIGQLQTDIQTETRRRLASEARVAELELEVESLEASVIEARNSAQAPATPRRGVNGVLGTPGRSASPGIFTPGASRNRPITSTHLVTENSQLKADLKLMTDRHSKVEKQMDDMLQTMENMAPELDELRSHKEQLTNTVSEMSSLLEDATKERELARKSARKLQGRVDGLEREKLLLDQLQRDLSNQLRFVITEVQAREEGLEGINATQQTYVQQVGNGDIEPRQDVSDTGALISRRLVLYKNVQELQLKNVELLTAIRGITERYEGREAATQSGQIEKDRQELEELREQCARYQDELQSMETRAKSFVTERDMFRRMLARRGQLPEGSEFGDSVDGRATATPPPGEPMQSVEQSPQSRSSEDYAKLVKDMTAHFDAYKQEAATDLASLKQQVDKLAKDRSELQSEVARYTSQLTLGHERYELLQSNFTMVKAENGELQKRTQSLQEVAARQDLLTQRAAEDYAEAKALADGMRNENANLKAERELWKKIEARISEDNRALLDERARLNKVIGDLQNLQNERELSDSENRRRLQNKLESLETELQTVKRKRDDELEDGKKLTLRREYEQDQSRARIDDLLKSLGNIREELVAAKTERDQLQARVDELKIAVQTAEERAQALQPRPTPHTNGVQGTSDSSDNEDRLSREQELVLEVSELKRDLELARSELETVKSHVETYKEIAQAAEEELHSFNETYEQYREEMEGSMAEKDAKIKDLEQRVDEISSELATTNQELSEVRHAQEEGTTAFNQQREILESEISRIKDDCERYQETARMHQEDLKAQAEIATQAQQSYENELVRHGEATKNLRTVRDEYNTLRSEVADIRAQGEAARTTLAQSEEHWNDTRQRYERELGELQTRYEDAKSQNKILHQQLESVSSQIASLKQSRVSIAGGEEEVSGPPSGLESLQEVIRYLRQEKEIVDVQYELSLQEARRLKQQLDHAQNQLDQTREKLNSERRAQADKEQNAISHSKLIETIEQLNLFRESSATLRNEARQAQAQLAEKRKEVDDLQSQIQPLQARVRELDNELEMKIGEYELLQQDRDRYQKRAQDILHKYDRVDPAELEALKTSLETLQTERDQAVAKLQPLQEQLNGVEERMRVATETALEEQKKLFDERKQKLIDQSKTRDKDKTNVINDIRQERDKLQQQLTEAKSELETTKTALVEALANAKANDASMQNAEEGQVDEGNATGFSLEEKEALEARAAQAEGRANQEANSAVALHIQLDANKGRVRDLESQLVSRLVLLDEGLQVLISN